MQIGLFQTARMEQRLLQSPQMIQAMQILQLSSLDLQERIEEELLLNPLLERAEPNEPGGRERTEDEGSELTALDAMRALRESDRWDPASRRTAGEASDAKREAMQNTPVPYHSLGQSLLSQTALIELDARQQRMLEFLVFSLDERGYLPVALAELVEESAIEGASVAGFALLLEELRHATHPALGARDLGDCLLLQVDEMVLEHALLRLIIAEFLPFVAANKIPHIARCTGRSLEEVGQAIEALRTLEPCPGSAYGEAPSEVIRPEVAVEEIEGTFQVRLTREGSPGLAISADYAELLKKAPKQSAGGDGARTWIKQHMGAARGLIDALAQRQSTLLCIGRVIFERQSSFLEKGTKAMQPLRMADVAEATGFHVSTVSRAVAGKYAQTPQGIRPLRSFFSGGTARAGGGVASQSSIQERVRELVEEEDSSAPLSDDDLARRLYERDGIRLARRTITKYRKALAIGCSSQRRTH